MGTFFPEKTRPFTKSVPRPRVALRPLWRLWPGMSLADERGRLGKLAQKGAGNTMRRQCVWSVLLITSTAAFAHAATLKFDMGKMASPVRPGFHKVTAETLYTAERGWGWKERKGLKEHDQVVPDGWRNKGVAALDLNEDMVYSGGENAFLVNLPPGNHRIYIVSGASGSFLSQYFDFTVTALTASMRVRTFGNCWYQKCVLDVAVTEKDTPVSITFTPKSLWLVNAMVIHPRHEEEKVREAFLDQMEHEIWVMPGEEWKKWEEVPHVDSKSPPAIGKAESRRGYFVYVPHYLDVLHPNTIPRPDQLGTEMRIFATLGEFEPVTFAVYPLRDIKGATIAVSDLRSQAGVIPAERIDVRHVRYVMTRLQHNKDYLYKVVPDILDHFQSIDLKKRQNERFWLTVHVPEQAAPGVYAGKVVFRPADGEAAVLSLKLRVLPIKLRQNPKKLYSIAYTDPRDITHAEDNVSKAYLERRALLERQDLIDHGITNHYMGLSRKTGIDGTPAMSYAAFGERVALYRRFGFRGPIITSTSFHWDFYRKYMGRRVGRHVSEGPPHGSGFFRDLQAKLAEIERERKKRGWPELLYYPVDEPGVNPFSVGLLKAFKEVAGVRTFCTLDPRASTITKILPYVDVLASSRYCWKAAAEYSKKYGTRFLCYPNFLTFHSDRTASAGSRMSCGFGLWRSGYDGFWIFKYNSTSGDPFNYLDAAYADIMVRTEPDGTPLPVVMWECMREGVDDERYVYTLQESIARAKRSRRPALVRAAAAAEQTLKAVYDATPAKLEYVYDGLWAGPEFDVYRSMIAVQILRLQKLQGAQ